MTDYEEEPRDDYEGGAPGGGRSPSPQRYDDRRSLSPGHGGGDYDSREFRDREYDRDYGRDYDRGYDRDRSPPPRRDREEPPASDEEDARNEGTNLFVTGLSRAVSEHELEDLFSKYGQVDKCQIMVDPHTKESRGFGFVNMVDVTGADTALSDLNGHVLSGKTLSIEKAKRKRPRTPTPGKYFGPPKPRRGGGRGGFGGGRYGDYRGGGGGYRDRYYGGGRGGRYDDRRYDDYYRRPSRYDDRDSRDRYYRDRGGGSGSRYGDDRYPPRDYREGGSSRYDRPPPPPRDERLPPRDAPPPPRDVSASRSYRDDYRDY